MIIWESIPKTRYLKERASIRWFSSNKQTIICTLTCFNVYKFLVNIIITIQNKNGRFLSSIIVRRSLQGKVKFWWPLGADIKWIEIGSFRIRAKRVAGCYYCLIYYILSDKVGIWRGDVGKFALLGYERFTKIKLNFGSIVELYCIIACCSIRFHIEIGKRKYFILHLESTCVICDVFSSGREG